jgi:hypothetical protein
MAPYTYVTLSLSTLARSLQHRHAGPSHVLLISFLPRSTGLDID